MAEKSKVALGVGRGIRLRCPACGEGHLFSSFLKVKGCETCGSDNTIYPSDDAPPYLTLILIGHFVVPFAFWAERVWAPAMWVHMAIWLPLITVVTLATLPFMKGTVIGFAWATGVTRETARQ